MSTGDWIAFASMLTSAASLLIGVVAIFFAAHEFRLGGKENRLTKELERAMARERRGQELLRIAAQRDNPNHGDHLAAIASLGSYPELMDATGALHEMYQANAKREPQSTAWPVVASAFAGALKAQRAAKIPV